MNWPTPGIKSCGHPCVHAQRTSLTLLKVFSVDATSNRGERLLDQAVSCPTWCLTGAAAAIGAALQVAGTVGVR